MPAGLLRNRNPIKRLNVPPEVRAAVRFTHVEPYDVSAVQDELEVGERILLTAQDDATENGVYMVNFEHLLRRAPDTNTAELLKPGVLVYAVEGDHAGIVWMLTSGRLGEPLTFTPINALEVDVAELNAAIDANSAQLNQLETLLALLEDGDIFFDNTGTDILATTVRDALIEIFTRASDDAAAAQNDATQALTDAATADGKAVAAQNDATQALTDAATADGKAVAAQNDATQALTDAATAQTTADNAVVGGNGVDAIVKLTQAAYDALDPADPDTLYVIEE